ncbi:MAG TPA: hypothetical protein VEQ35_07725 [Beijerinckia sp.]|jgi:hypothetical protein|nr:hypothetical protein [Beijerinckia sp.]
MADERGEGSEIKPEPFAAARALRREPPIIDGKAEGVEASSAMEGPPADILPEEVAATEVPPPFEEKRTQSRAWPFISAVILGALLGGALGTAGSYGLRYVDGSHEGLAWLDEQIAGLNTRLEEVEKNNEALGVRSRDVLALLDKRLVAAEAGANSARGLNTRLEEIEKNNEALGVRSRDALALLDKRLVAAEAAANSARGDAQKALGRPIPVPSSAATNPAPAANPLPAANSVDLAPIEARISKLEQRLVPLETTLAASKTDVRAPQDRDAGAADPALAATRTAIVAASLGRKIARGVPFTGEISVLDTLGVDKAKLAVLRPLAGTGVASTKKLAEQFASVSDSILASPNEDHSENFLERLARDAARLVRIRRVDATSGTDLPDLVAGIENALAHDDVEEALTLWTQLPADAKSKSEAFASAARERLAVLSAARAIESDALASLGKPKS